MLKIICAAALILGGSAAGLTQAALAQGSATPDVVKDLAPTGKLSAAINVTNRVLAQEDPAGAFPVTIPSPARRSHNRRAKSSGGK